MDFGFVRFRGERPPIVTVVPANFKGFVSGPSPGDEVGRALELSGVTTAHALAMEAGNTALLLEYIQPVEDSPGKHLLKNCVGWMVTGPNSGTKCDSYVKEV